ncbi:hypothetical protein O3M35_007097 [Rhynocoris fuscipes]|uniref:Uncharacterized protein n=1 Tax=Rhynocoris fuscipes TaxID=488301 RepID=A0AAW1DF94_9HEMI
MDTKILLLLVLGFVATTWAYPKTACGSGPSHDLIMGQRQYGDRMLYTSREKKSKSILRVGVTDIKWPLRGMQIRETITRVEVLDQKHDGSGGCAFLVGGGVGSSFLNLHLKTQRGGSFDFLINIYGR